MLTVSIALAQLITLQAIILAKLHDEDFPDILRYAAGVVFLGTPHKGSRTQSKEAIIANIASMFGQAESKNLLGAVEKDSDMLNDLVHDFTRVVNKAAIPLFCFFEQRKSNLARLFKPMDKGLPQFRVRDPATASD
jgi:hypothetical protein